MVDRVDLVERNEKIRRLRYTVGMPVEEIAARFDLTESRVYQIAPLAGKNPPDPDRATELPVELREGPTQPRRCPTCGQAYGRY